MKKTLLLTGVNGQVGHALQNLLDGYQVVAVSREQLDLSNADQIRQVVRTSRPALIINPAAYTAVDKAESEPALAFAVNAQAPQVLAEEAARLGAGLIHFSTDYVYDGNKHSVYLESDPVNPVSVYGKSKLAGEEAIRSVGLPHLILRTSWVYGSYGKNFLKTIVRLAGERESLRIVADQHGAPTSAISIAQSVATLIERWQPDNQLHSGVYHLVNAGETSWHGFASAIVSSYQAMAESRGWPSLQVKEILPIAASEYPTPAQRPSNSRLSTQKLQETFGVVLPDWQVALQQVMQQVQTAA